VHSRGWPYYYHQLYWGQAPLHFQTGTRISKETWRFSGFEGILKGTGSRERIQIFGQKWKVLAVNKHEVPLLLFKLSKWSSDEMLSFAFATRLRGKQIGELTFIGGKSTEFNCGSCVFPLYCSSLSKLFIGPMFYSSSHEFSKLIKDHSRTAKKQ
jgi:hypothetical protein